MSNSKPASNIKQINQEKISVIFILGRPGSGKGTLCQLIVDHKLGFCHLSAGELLRDERTNLSSVFKDRLDTHFEDGTTVDPTITVSLLLDSITRTSATHLTDDGTFYPNSVYLVDGFPPNLDNLKVWQEQLEGKPHLNVTVPFIIYLDASEETCLTRCLKRGRANSGKSSDTPSNIIKRFQKFTRETAPVIELFSHLSLTKRFDGNESSEIVFEQVLEFLNSI